MSFGGQRGRTGENLVARTTLDRTVEVALEYLAPVGPLGRVHHRLARPRADCADMLGRDQAGRGRSGSVSLAQ
jgi:hypothetical protein